MGIPLTGVPLQTTQQPRVNAFLPGKYLPRTECGVEGSYMGRSGHTTCSLYPVLE